MDNENYQRFVKLFEYKFPHPLLKTNVDVVTPAEKGSKTNSTIRVIMLNGDFTSLAFNPNMTIKTVKEHISKELKVSVNRQRLLLNGKELKVK